MFLSEVLSYSLFTRGSADCVGATRMVPAFPTPWVIATNRPEEISSAVEDHRRAFTPVHAGEMPGSAQISASATMTASSATMLNAMVRQLLATS
jgi:hypothetical protein